ncbi:3-carboxy-cis,cis-muconate cycloisomerase [Defluviimonas aquaemixtae]|uniref:3-carboxy-cis,cis-muconate cycloisomerase n=1 Tax=Albidovulum aquaemixtae TaxID=1542388 RepID=A0A2R8BNN7_9RHOB|nr:3-carboxy-cis,cis-muconate cycloisomerase [Defluviimonas aquaemixtae]SPH25053.1 3-carboxy-cis,cis-muconate cycloisomerase [Defluviimonas aquaemixtae]
MTDVFHHSWLGGLFGDDEMAAIWSAESQLANMLRFEAAWSRALGRAGLVNATAANATAEAILTVKPDIAELRDGTARDGVPVPALVAAVKHALPGADNSVHQGATSQDVIDTALALSLRATSDLFLARIAALEAALHGLADKFGRNTMMGRTRMQAAVPIRVADHIDAWSGPLARHGARIADIRPRVEQLQFGGAAGNRAAVGDAAPAIAKSLATDLGLANPPRAWHAERDGVAEYGALLSLLTGALGKMGQDICLMAQRGIDEIRIRGSGGSSAMPHKQNPIPAEILVTLARFNATLVSGLHHSLVHEQERSGAAWALEWMILPQMAEATARALTLATSLTEHTEVMGR